eukprot:1441718-Rhodomonas_salina.4
MLSTRLGRGHPPNPAIDMSEQVDPIERIRRGKTHGERRHIQLRESEEERGVEKEGSMTIFAPA